MRNLSTCIFVFFFFYICRGFNFEELPVTIDVEELTDHWAVEIPKGEDANKLAETYGFEMLGPVGVFDNIYNFKKKEHTIHGITHPHISLLDPKLVWFERQVSRQRQKRIPSDPLYSQQWHLHLTSSTKISVNIEEAWNLNFTGEGVVIAVVDDGLEYTHPDIKDNYRADSSYDFNYNDNNPFPDFSYDTHGTPAAGAAGARDNSACGVGTAYRAGLSGIRLISKASTDSQEAGALTYKNNINSIYSNSWGPVDDGKRLEGPGRLASMAIETGILQGRSGKGNIYVWAAGNGKRSGDNCNYDGWANSKYTISIGAVDTSGYSTWYSEPCSMLVACTPSSSNTLSITTTDLMGSRGYSSTSDCTSSFGGTSAAAPIAAGIVAILLQSNPLLTWRDVQGILVSTSIKNDPTDTDWVLNGANLWVNHKYGFGTIHAGNAVKKALTWQLLAPYIQTSIDLNQSISIPESTTNYLVVPLQITTNFIVEHVELNFRATHSRRGDLRIILQSPSNTTSVLAEYHSDVNANYNWTFGSIRCWGEYSMGNWLLKIRDEGVSNTGYFTGATLKIYGH